MRRFVDYWNLFHWARAHTPPKKKTPPPPPPQDKFRLDFDDEAAVEWMQGLINESATALLPQLVETTHRWAQYWR